MSMMTFLSLLFYLWFFSSALFTLATFAAFPLAKPGCASKCGNVDIYYPFGVLEKECSLSKFYEISCNTSYDPHIPYLGNGSIEILDMSITGQMRIRNIVATEYFQGGELIQSNSVDWVSTSLNNRPTVFSDTKNKFILIGCDDYAYIFGTLGRTYRSGCDAGCSEPQDVINGSCTGIGCCQTSFQRGEEDKFTFNVGDLNDSEFVNRTMQSVPMVLEWFVGQNQSCVEAKRNMSANVCQNNSNCIDFDPGPGYRCSCLTGYEGNPYLTPGCTDIKECANATNKCSSICTNIPGSYKCSCPKGYQGDGFKNGTGCFRQVLSSTLGSTLLVLLGWWLYTYIKKRSAIKKRAQFFERNGGLLLQQQMSSNEGILERTKIFTIDDLEKATDNFSESRILGQGGHGTVYKGMLSEGKLVAIKKSKIVDETEQAEFINEVIILSQINHRNIVKLLGCCLESEVPLLVFEFIPNGTLFQHIHYPSEEFLVTWRMRQQIALDSAGAIAYLHSSSSVPIFHRDIKSSNILLDEKYRAKLSDFGTSRHLATDQTHVTTRVMGTLGYLDSEYFQSSQFTEKSDVYSFGVVLVELLTGQKAIRAISEKDRSLVAWFLSHMENSNLVDIVDSQVLKEGSKEEICRMADLAKRCLNLDGKRRPTMKLVL